MTTEKNTFHILKEFRDQHETKCTRAFTSFLIFLGIFIIDAITIFNGVMNNWGMTMFAWVGVWTLILAMAFSLKDYIIETSAIKKIDGYYLEKLYKYESKQ